MRKCLVDKNVESKFDIGHSGKRLTKQAAAFADSFNAQLRDEESSRQETRQRTHAEPYRMQRQQPSSPMRSTRSSSSSNYNNNNNSNSNDNRREYRRDDVVAVQYLTVRTSNHSLLLLPTTTHMRCRRRLLCIPSHCILPYLTSPIKTLAFTSCVL